MFLIGRGLEETTHQSLQVCSIHATLAVPCSSCLPVCTYTIRASNRTLFTIKNFQFLDTAASFSWNLEYDKSSSNHGYPRMTSISPTEFRDLSFSSSDEISAANFFFFQGSALYNPSLDTAPLLLYYDWVVDIPAGANFTFVYSGVSGANPGFTAQWWPYRAFAEQGSFFNRKISYCL
jgi:hypothetical protein